LPRVNWRDTKSFAVANERPQGCPVVTLARRRTGMSLGARLKQLRIKNNRSLQDVADAVGASKAHIWEVERGASQNPTMDLLNRLADYFDVSVSYLVGETTDENEAGLVAMYRELRSLSPDDREKIRGIMKVFKEKKGRK
jgi:transcriptional regulator with XRE-family HTH domain